MLARDNLYPYQNRAIDFIKTHPNCAIWKDPGLGKTVDTLTAFSDLINSFEASRMLVVAPKRVAQRVWDAEVAEWSHLQGLRVAKIIGTPRERRAAISARADIWTINRENVKWLEEEFVVNRRLVSSWPWDTVVLDESQSFKAQSSQRFKSMRKLRPLFPRCVQLTGTPAPNGYSDLWSQLFLLDRGERLGHTETAYRQRWFTEDYSGYGWTLREGAAKEIQAAIADITLVMRAEDYLDLPPVTYNKVMVSLSPAVMDRYRKLAKYCIYEAKQKTITAVNAGVLRSKLLQLANGAIYVDEHRNYETLHEEKIHALEEVLDGLPRPVLIGYSFVADRLRLAESLNRLCKGAHRTWRHLDGNNDFDAFAAGSVDYGLAHPGSMGHGLNDIYKSGAENAVWFGLTDNLEFYQQFNARLTGGHRRVNRAVVIHHVLCDNTQDVETFGLITRKGVTQDDLTRSIVNLARSVR